ncbi:hypothetical protein CWS43_24495 [Rahnella sp. AA]|uniref:hypothetical protein n=1 Tax=Rahnella sp. AA TaxID=2057180 RepID=UPI000C339078|nr:hypothetical protein [Rahnella sp. AA]PKE27839.1 hypothetical protein CWS43_24495 [Rahnella sp. AA]
MFFQNPKRQSRDALISDLASNDVNKICAALVSISFYESDWKWAQDICLDCLKSDNIEVSKIAATCLGHIVRIHGMLEIDKVLDAFKQQEKNKAISGYISDAIDDINIFLVKNDV